MVLKCNLNLLLNCFSHLIVSNKGGKRAAWQDEEAMDRVMWSPVAGRPRCLSFRHEVGSSAIQAISALGAKDLTFSSYPILSFYIHLYIGYDTMLYYLSISNITLYNILYIHYMYVIVTYYI